MSDERGSTKDEVIDANIQVHSFLVRSGAYQESPHFRPENQAKVRAVVERLTDGLRRSAPSKAIDFGCGTGFMIALMHDRFDEVHGIDITPEMMARVDLSPGHIRLHECRADATPFADGSFDFATAYSFMDHLADYRAFLREASRVLRDGGVFYSDLNPNRDFIQGIESAARRPLEALPPRVRREVGGALHNGAHYQQTYGLDAATLERAEPIKSLDKGFDADEVLAVARDVGFSQARVEYQWFLGEASVLHGESAAAAATVDGYLQTVLPVSGALYKYLRFVFVK